MEKTQSCRQFSASAEQGTKPSTGVSFSGHGALLVTPGSVLERFCRCFPGVHPIFIQS